MRVLCAWLRTVGVLCALGVSCALWVAAPALAHSHYTYASSFGVAGSGAGGLSSPQSVAVDQETGNVYVADTGNNRVDEFEADGVFVRAWGWGVLNGAAEAQVCTTSCLPGIPSSAPGALEAPTFIAVDDSPGGEGDVYVADQGHELESPDNLVSKFDKNGHLIETWGAKGQLNGSSAPEGQFGELSGIAVDGTGNLWVYVGSTFAAPDTHMYEFEQGGGFTQSWTEPLNGGEYYPHGIAVDGSDNLYISSTVSVGVSSGPSGPKSFVDGAVLKYGSSGGFLGQMTETPVIAGVAVAGLTVDPVTNDVYVDTGSSVKHFASSCKPEAGVCTPLESFGTSQSVGGAGLAVDSASGSVYVAVPGSDAIVVFEPEVLSPPTVEGQSVSLVTSSSATFSASVDPRGLEAKYRFEYGPTSAYGETVPVPGGVVGSGFEAQEVSAHVQDLSASTTYHFRVVSYNEKGTAYGADQTFVTQTSGGALVLPDDRQWEMVTPAQKQGALFYGQNYAWWSNAPKPFVAEAAADGSGIVNLASQPTESEPQGYSGEVSVLSRRGGTGWSSRVIAPPHDEGTGTNQLNKGVEYRFFSEDLSKGIVQPFGSFTPLSPEAAESTAYLKTNYASGNTEEFCTSLCFRPLVAAANVSSGTVFGEETNGKCKGFICGPYFEDATPDLSHIILSSGVEFVPSSGGSVQYEWSAGRLQPLDILPEGEEGLARLAGARLTGASSRVYDVARAIENGLESREAEADGSTRALSSDGTRAVLLGKPRSTGKYHLYDRDMAQGKTVRLDIFQGIAPGPETGAPEYMTASVDGSRIFFLDRERLTANASLSGSDLYEYDLNAPEGSRLRDLTGNGGSGEPVNVQMVLGASEDGSYVYYVNAVGVYVSDEGHSRLVAGDPTVGNGWSRVSPDGRWLAFMSNMDLTGYDTHDAITGHPDEEVYLYSVASGTLVCASCDPTGARPVGVESNKTFSLVGGAMANGIWTAANVPPRTLYDGGGGGSRYQPRYLSNAGVLFFDSFDALVPQDVDGTQDVYEYEPVGDGSCSGSSVTFSERSGGCVNLISAGTSADESAFLDASATGGDVFFLTTSKLVSQDFDNALDVYDAHTCRAEAPCYPLAPTVPPACSTGDGCKVAPSPQPSIFGPTSSATFSGAGNVVPSPPASGVKRKSLTRAQKIATALKACHKKGRRQRVLCERRVRQSYAAASRKPRGTGIGARSGK